MDNADSQFAPKLEQHKTFQIICGGSDPPPQNKNLMLLVRAQPQILQRLKALFGDGRTSFLSRNHANMRIGGHAPVQLRAGNIEVARRAINLPQACYDSELRFSILARGVWV